MSRSAEPTPRISLPDLTPGLYTGLIDLTGAVARQAADVGLEPSVPDLVRIRASQINGCTFCLAMHTDEALANGETRERLDALSAWDGSALFTGRERAALALTESVTLVHDGGVPDAVYQRAADEFDDAQLAVLLWTAAVINVFNRLAIATGLYGGR